MATTNRITKTEYFDAISAMLDGKSVSGITVSMAQAFISKEKELIAKKNASRKSSSDSEETENAKTLIYDFLTIQTEGKTATEIWKGIPELFDRNPNWVSVRVRALVEEGRVINEKVKGKSLFRVA